jgi:hypothetical protein
LVIDAPVPPPASMSVEDYPFSLNLASRFACIIRPLEPRIATAFVAGDISSRSGSNGQPPESSQLELMFGWDRWVTPKESQWQSMTEFGCAAQQRQR